jgi:hypothetical protein
VALVSPPFLFKSPPATFEYLLRDALVVLGLPYGPQAREKLALALPTLFGRSNATLNGYERWRDREARLDTPASFAQYMDGRFKRWFAAFTSEP